LSRKFKRVLQTTGIEYAAFQSTRSLRSRIQANFRNHRKNVVIDGRVAYVGGHNIGNAYLGLDAQIGAWRDTHARISGSAALQAQLTSIEDWFWAKRRIPDGLCWQLSEAPSGNSHVLVLGSGPAENLQTCEAMFTQAID